MIMIMIILNNISKCKNLHDFCFCSLPTDKPVENNILLVRYFVFFTKLICTFYGANLYEIISNFKITPVKY